MQQRPSGVRSQVRRWQGASGVGGADDDLAIAIGAGQAGVGRAEQPEAGNAERRGEVHQAGIEADGDLAVADDGGKLRAGHHPRQDDDAVEPGGEALGARLFLVASPGKDDRPAGAEKAFDQAPPARLRPEF